MFMTTVGQGYPSMGQQSSALNGNRIEICLRGGERRNSMHKPCVVSARAGDGLGLVKLGAFVCHADPMGLTLWGIWNG